MTFNFWDKLFSEKKMVLGLSPMDGVTDVAMRYMTAKYSGSYSRVAVEPYSQNESKRENGFTDSRIHEGVDLLFTEFVSVDALHYAKGERRERLLKTFMRAKDVDSYIRKAVEPYSQSESKLENGFTDSRIHEYQYPYEIAQVFGHTPELFAEAAELVESLGFDGIDINMGCPMHKVEDQGSGAGLIRTPELAQEIIRVVKASTKLPVSVKTRIGVNSDVAEEWMETLMAEKPANISLHGRTLRQLYQGSADWEAIGRAAAVVHKHGGHILGNGDVDSVDQAQEKVDQYGVDGVLIGRGAEGNPGIFNSPIPNSQILQLEPSKEQRFAWMIEHAKLYESIFKYSSNPVIQSSSELRENRNTGKPENDNRWFMPMRKHLAWYCKGFQGAVEMRAKLMLCNSSEDVQAVISTEVERSFNN